MYELELFAGAGGGILGKNLLGFTTVGAVEVLPYCRKVLLQRQRDQCCPMFPIWDDVRTFRLDNPECAAYIEWLRGIAGEKSGLWREMARIVGEIRPAFAFVENSPLLVRRGLEVVLSDLAEMGYDATWCVLGAGHLGYPFKRDRLWLLGKHQSHHGRVAVEGVAPADYLWRGTEVPALPNADRARLVADGYAGRDVDGVADRVDRIAALGNGQVPAVAALAFRILSGAL